MNDLTLVRVHNPFHRAERDTRIIHYQGDTLHDLVPAGLRCAVSLNGVVVYEHQWREVIPQPGDHILVVPVVSGSDTGKMIGRIIASIVIAVAAYYTGHLEFLKALGPVWAATAAAAVMVVGGMLVNALLPMPTAKAKGANTQDNSIAYSWAPQTTQQQGIAIARAYGRLKLYGNVISTYIESDVDLQYLSVLICLGQGPYQTLSDYQINNQPVDNFTGIIPEPRLGYNDQPAIANFSDTKIEYSVSRKVTAVTPVVYTTTGDNFDGLEVELTCPNGLWKMDNSGNMIESYVDVKVSVSPENANTWTVLSSTAGNWEYRTLGGWYEVISHTTDDHITVYDVLAGPLPPLLYGDDENGYYYYPYTEGASGQHGGVYKTFGINFMVYPPTWSTLSVKVYIGSVDKRRLVGNKQKTYRFNFKYTVPSVGRYDIKIERLTADNTDTRVMNDVYLGTVRETFKGDNITYPGLALVGIRALANDQLSGSLGFSCLANCLLVQVYNGSEWAVQWSDNPAWICYDVLTLPVYDNDLNVTRYDGFQPSQFAPGALDRFIAWAAWCATLCPDGKGGTEPRFTFNGVFDADTSLWEAALTVARCGGATLLLQGSMVQVVIDKPAPVTQLFSVGNIGVNSFSETWLPMQDRVTTIECDFTNADQDYTRDQVTVVNSEMSAGTNRMSMQLVGVTSPGQAWRHAMRLLKNNQHLLRTADMSVDIDSIACEVGDVVMVQHDVPQWGYGGRIVSATSTTVTLDCPVTMTAGNSYALMVRLADDTLVERTVVFSSGTHTVITVSTPLPSVPPQFAIWAFGPTALIAKPFRIAAITPNDDLGSATLSMLEYNESIYGMDTGEPVYSTPQYSLLPTGFPVVAPSYSERLAYGPGGSIDAVMTVSWNADYDTYIFPAAQIGLISGSGEWTVLATTTGTSGEVVMAPGEYTIGVRLMDGGGRMQALQYIYKMLVRIFGKTLPPSPVGSITVTLTRGAMRISWDHIPDLDRLGYTVVLSSAGPNASPNLPIAPEPGEDMTNILLAREHQSNSIEWTPSRTGLISIFIQSVDTSGNVSTSWARRDYTIYNPSAPANVRTVVVTNNVMLLWTPSTPGTFPIATYRLYSGTDWSTAQLLGEVTGSLHMRHEAIPGQYKYWVQAVDVAGLASSPVGVYCTVLKNPDYVLLSRQQIDLSACTLVNACVEVTGITLPINTSLTWQQHFQANPDTTQEPWTNISGQLLAGYGQYGNPAAHAEAYIEKIIDYGGSLPAATISVDVTRHIPNMPVPDPLGFIPLPTGPPLEFQMWVSANGSTWILLGSSFVAFAKNFRFVKIRLTVPANSHDGLMLIVVNSITITLDVLHQNYAGKVNITDVSGDGTIVTFATLGITPVDIIGITAEAPYTGVVDNDPITVLVNFSDTANPTNFKLLAWNKSGQRVAVNDVVVTIKYC